MERPLIYCHMMSSLDGKLIGDYMETEEAEAAGYAYYTLAFGEDPYYKNQGWIFGRAFTDENFTMGKRPELSGYMSKEADAALHEDHIAAGEHEKYYIAIDPKGRLAWEENSIEYVGEKLHIVEVLTYRAGDDYRAYLKDRGISYINAGACEDPERLDLEAAMIKLKNKLGIDSLMLGGGSVLNWSFIKAGICDELSIVMAAAADGAIETPGLFREHKGIDEAGAVRFMLKEAKALDGDALWLRYGIKNN